MTYAVLYTNDLEPITVLQLPPRAAEMLSNLGRVALEVMEPVQLHPSPGPIGRRPRQVVIRGELFAYKGAKKLMLFTEDEESALLLRSAFLPGQRRTLNDEKALAFAEGFTKALMMY